VCKKLSTPFFASIKRVKQQPGAANHLTALSVWRLQGCVNTTPRKKDISSDLRDTIVAAYQSGKGYKAISKIVHDSTARKKVVSLPWVISRVLAAKGDSIIWCT